jgi:cell filamentation protein
VDEDPYCWPGTTCLRNLLGIRDPARLETAEHEIVGVRAALLTVSGVPGAYDTVHLFRFHRLLFRDVYDWAGRPRTGNIARGDQSFCPAPLLASRLEQLLAGLAAHRFLVALDREAFVASLASLYGELNAIHPFREGNGRTQRAFLRQLAAHAGWTVAWEALRRPANDGACRQYLVSADPGPLAALLAPVVTPRP